MARALFILPLVRGEPPQAAGGRLRRTFAVLFLRCAPYSRFLLTCLGSNHLGDSPLSTSHELHRSHTYARQEGCLRASYEQSICRMPTVLDEQLITGHRYHHLAARGDLIFSRV